MHEAVRENINNESQQQSEAELILGSEPSFEEHLKRDSDFVDGQQAEQSQASKNLEIHTVYHDGTSAEDSQIRAGLLTHLRVEPGDSIADINEKLDYLKSQGKHAFAFFNNERIENWSEKGEDKKEESSFSEENVTDNESKIKDSEGVSRIVAEVMGKTELEKKAKQLEVIDRTTDVPNWGKYGMVGILGGVKEATEFLTFHRAEEADKECKHVEEQIESLGLNFVKDSVESPYSPGEIEVQYYIAKDDETAKRVQELVVKSREEGQAGQYTRELGQLFGFPASAVEYFIKRNKENGYQKSTKQNEKYHSYIHSLEYGEEEYKEYEEKIDGLFKKYCPTSAYKLFQQLEHINKS